MHGYGLDTDRSSGNGSGLKSSIFIYLCFVSGLGGLRDWPGFSLWRNTNMHGTWAGTGKRHPFSSCLFLQRSKNANGFYDVVDTGMNGKEKCGKCPMNERAWEAASVCGPRAPWNRTNGKKAALQIV